MAELSNQIAAETRESFGKGAARKLRAVGKIPAVIYGHGTDPRHVSLPGHQLTLLVRKANQVLELVVDGDEVLALIKDVQRDPVRQIIEHLDLIIVRTGEQVEVEVPVNVEGESAPGTVANLDSQTLLLKVLATAIPQNVTVSIEGLEDGAKITAADVTLPEGAELAGDPELLIIGVQLEAAEESAENEGAAAESDSTES